MRSAAPRWRTSAPTAAPCRWSNERRPHASGWRRHRRGGRPSWCPFTRRELAASVARSSRHRYETAVLTVVDTTPPRITRGQWVGAGRRLGTAPGLRLVTAPAGPSMPCRRCCSSSGSFSSPTATSPAAAAQDPGVRAERRRDRQRRAGRRPDGRMAPPAGRSVAARRLRALLRINLMNPRWMAFGDVRLSLVFGFGLAWVSPIALLQGFLVRQHPGSPSSVSC